MGWGAGEEEEGGGGTGAGGQPDAVDGAGGKATSVGGSVHVQHWLGRLQDGEVGMLGAEEGALDACDRGVEGGGAAAALSAF